jgi:hypothetical protein
MPIWIESTGEKDPIEKLEGCCEMPQREKPTAARLGADSLLAFGSSEKRWGVNSEWGLITSCRFSFSCHTLSAICPWDLLPSATGFLAT